MTTPKRTLLAGVMTIGLAAALCNPWTSSPNEQTAVRVTQLPSTCTTMVVSEELAPDGVNRSITTQEKVVPCDVW